MVIADFACLVSVQINHDRRSLATLDGPGPIPVITLQEDSDLKDDFSDLTDRKSVV